MKDIERLINPHILNMAPYSSARDDFKGEAEVYLDANESWFEGEVKCNRYPDPECVEVRKLLESVLSLPFEKTVLGNGSDEIIDLLIRIFCEYGKDSIMIMRPTYGAYKVFAATNNIEVVNVPLTPSLELDMDAIKSAIDKDKPKLVFICTPNNPTGKVYPLSQIEEIAKYNSAITVIDEAYADFAPNFESAVSLIDKYPRLCVMRTLSKAWGIAGARVGILVANEYIKSTVVKVKPPYNVSVLAQRAAKLVLSNPESVYSVRDEVLSDRERLQCEIAKLPFVREIIPSEANFLAVRVLDADELYKYLMERGIIVRNRTKEPFLDGVLRITIGSKIENEKLMEALLGYSK